MDQNGALKRDDNDQPVMGGTSSADNETIINAAFDPITRRLLTDLTTGGGTVETIGVTSANGFAGTSNADPVDPRLTISTTINAPVLAGNGTAIAAATTTGSGSTVVLGTGPSISGATITTSSVNGVTLTTGGSATTYLNGAGAYTTPADTGITQLTGDVTAGPGSGSQAATLATVNSNVGAFGSATQSPTFTVNGKGLTTAAANVTITPAVGSITGLGTGVATALAVNVGSAGAFVTFNGALGTPSSGTVTNLTGTASININGTVGATTPTTGVFTTLVAGSTTSLLLGTAGSAVGNIGFRNATSGTITLAPVAGALGTVTLTLPAITDTLVTLTASQTLTNKTLTAPAIGGTALLAEGASIGLDPAGSADGAYSGITMTATAGYTQAFGDLVYLAVADGRWELADADAASTAGPVALAMVVVAGTDGNSCTLLTYGRIRADAKFPTMTVGATQYVGETAGAIQGAIPTGADNIIRTVGYAMTADELWFAPSSDWQVTVA